MMLNSLLALVACSGGGVVVVGGDTGSATTASSDTGATGDTGASSDSGTADTEDTTPPEPVPDTSVWEGEIVFNYDTWGEDGDCNDERVSETSYRPTEAELAALAAECPACTDFYWTVPSEAQICGWLDLPPEDLRGLVLGDGWAQVYRFSGSVEEGFEGELLDSAATYDGWTVTFTAELSVWWTPLYVEGTLTFPETSSQDTR